MILGNKEMQNKNQDTCRICDHNTLQKQIRVQTLIKKFLDTECQQGIELLKTHKKTYEPFTKLVNMIFIQRADQTISAKTKCAHLDMLELICKRTKLGKKQIQMRSKALITQLLGKEYQMHLLTKSIRQTGRDVFRIAIEDQTRVYKVNEKAKKNQETRELNKKAIDQFRPQNDQRKLKKMLEQGQFNWYSQKKSQIQFQALENARNKLFVTPNGNGNGALYSPYLPNQYEFGLNSFHQLLNQDYYMVFGTRLLNQEVFQQECVPSLKMQAKQ